MNAEQRVRLVIGEMTVQAAILQTAVEERDAKIKELEGRIAELTTDAPVDATELPAD